MTPISRIAPGPARAMRTAISLAGGNEVCFACTVSDEGIITAARPVARGDVSSVLALPGFAQRGEMLVHNHPSGDPTPSAQDVVMTAELAKACKIFDIDLLDHVIIGRGRFLSMKEVGLGFPKG